MRPEHGEEGACGTQCLGGLGFAVYRLESRPLEVVRVLSGCRDVAELLS